MLKYSESCLVLSIKLFEFFFKINFRTIWINVLMKLVENRQVTQLTYTCSKSNLLKVQSLFRTQLKILAFFREIFYKKLHCRCWTGSTIPTPLKLMIKTSEHYHSCHSCAFSVDFKHISHKDFHVYFTFFTNISQMHVFIVLNN